MFGKCIPKLKHQKMLLYRAEIHLTKLKFVELLQDDADEKQELHPKFRTSGGVVLVCL